MAGRGFSEPGHRHRSQSTAGGSRVLGFRAIFVHGLGGVDFGAGRSVGAGDIGEAVGVDSGMLEDSVCGVAIGTGTSNPGLMAAAGLVFSTGGSS
jgi:hypothetical protein